MKNKLDLSYIRESIGDDDVMLMELIDSLIRDSNTSLSNMQNAIRKSDVARLKELLHRIRPSLLSVGEKKAGEMALSLEELCENGTDSREIFMKFEIFQELVHTLLGNLTAELSELSEKLKDRHG